VKDFGKKKAAYAIQRSQTRMLVGRGELPIDWAHEVEY
jgi:hypothetical protein